jgi:hypothetical protein
MAALTLKNLPADLVVTTWITAAVLSCGAAKSRAAEGNRGLVQEFLATLPVLGLDEASSQIFGGGQGDARTPGPASGGRRPLHWLHRGGAEGHGWRRGTGATTSAFQGSTSRTGSGTEGH